MTYHIHQMALIGADIASAVAIVATFAGIFPPLAALAALCWYGVQIWETDTVQTWVKGHRHVKRKRRTIHKHPPEIH